MLTICGAGAQARTQLAAIALVRPITTVNVYDIRPESTARYIEEMSAKYPAIKFVPVADKNELASAVSGSDITVCVTLADLPIIEADWLKKGSLLMNMADYEVTYDCVKKADKIYCDNWDMIKHRMISTVALMYKDGLIKDEDIDGQLGEVLLGRKAGRDNDEQIIYFNAVGMGITDIAVITRAYKKAKAQGKGIVLPFWE